MAVRLTACSWLKGLVEGMPLVTSDIRLSRYPGPVRPA
jgi:hypothetical protein